MYNERSRTLLPDSVRGIEGGWENKRQHLLEVLSQKVNFVTYVFDQTEKIDAANPDVSGKMEALWEEAAKFFPADIIPQARRYGELAQALRVLHEQEIEESAKEREDHEDDEEFEEYITTEMMEKYEEREVLREKLHEEAQSLKDQAGQVEFLGDMKAHIGALIDKHKIVSEIPEDIEGLILAVEKIVPDVQGKIKPESIARVERGAFSISIVLHPKEYERIKEERSLGVHYSNTPLSFIKADQAQSETDTIHHENIHNLTDGVVVTGDPVKSFHSRLERYKRERVRSNGYLSVAELELKRIDRVSGMIDALHGEILATFEHAEEENFGSSANFLDSANEFNRRAGTFDTAGNQIIALSRAIQKARSEAKDDERLWQVLTRFDKALKQKFISTIEHMEKLLRVAETAGPKVRDEVEALFFILKPSQYGHIAEYVREYHGMGVFADAEAIRQLSNFFTLDDIQSGIKLLKKRPELLTPKVKADIIKNGMSWRGELLGQTKEAGMHSLADMREYVAGVKELAVLCGDEGNFDGLHLHAIHAYISDKVEIDVHHDFANLLSLSDSLHDEDEKEELYAVLFTYIDGGFIFEDREDIENMTALKKSPLWDAIKRMGFAERLEKEVRD